MALVFAVGPVLSEDEGEGVLGRFTASLATALGAEVRGRAFGSYGALEAALEKGEVDLAWLSPALFVRSERRGAKLLAAIERPGGRRYHGVVFVRADDPAQDAADLKGRRVAWVDPDSCAGHLFPLAALRERGHEPGALFAEGRFWGSHGEVVRAVARGEADAGATYAQLDATGELLLAAWTPWTGAASMRPLLYTAPIPTDVIASRAGLGSDRVDGLRAALIGLADREGGPLALDDLFGGPRLIEADPERYETVREVLAR